MSRRRAFNGVVRRYACFLVLSCGAALFLPLIVHAQVKRSTPPPAPTPDGAANVPAAQTAFAQLGSEVAAIFAKSKDAVVRIYATDFFGTCVGTGFFIDPSGTIYTHFSVVGRSSNVLVEFAGKKYPATCLLADPRSGVTLLSIHAGSTPFLPLAHATDLQIASPIIAIGYPMDLPLTPTFGLVAGLDQKLPEGYLPTTHIRANVPMQPGEQGAPLLNEKGEVVGMVVCGFDYGAVCLGLPIQAAEKVRGDYLRFGRTRPGWVGITARPVGDAGEESGVAVDDLANDGPAAHSGLAVGDVLVRVGNMPIHKLADLHDASFYLTADQAVPIVVQRGGKQLTVQTHASDPPGVSMALPPLISNHAPDINTKLDPP